MSLCPLELRVVCVSLSSRVESGVCLCLLELREVCVCLSSRVESGVCVSMSSRVESGMCVSMSSSVENVSVSISCGLRERHSMSVLYC